MASTITKVTIANRALQILGYQPITSVDENSRGAKAVKRAYDSVLLAELRSNYWGFSIRRAILAASTSQPVFGKNYYYPLPGDYVMIAPPDQKSGTPGALPAYPYQTFQGEDWTVENDGQGHLCVVTDQVSPINVRYVTSDVTEAMFDYAFAEAFAAALAVEICEELTQSNSKLQNAEKIYDDVMQMAKKRNAFEQPPREAKVDSWIRSRF